MGVFFLSRNINFPVKFLPGISREKWKNKKRARARLGGHVLEDERGQSTNTTQNKVRAVALGLCTIHVVL